MEEENNSERRSKEMEESDGAGNEMIEDSEAVSDKYRLDFALLAPLKLSLFPAKSFPSVVSECGNKDSVLRSEMYEIDSVKGTTTAAPKCAFSRNEEMDEYQSQLYSSIETPERKVVMQQTPMTNLALPMGENYQEEDNSFSRREQETNLHSSHSKPLSSMIQRVKQGSLLRRRSSSLPDIDRINLSEEMTGLGVGSELVLNSGELFRSESSSHQLHSQHYNEDLAILGTAMGSKSSSPYHDRVGALKSKTICGKTYSCSTTSLSYAEKEKPLTGMRSLPRINRSPMNDMSASTSSVRIPSHKGPITLAMSAVECAGSFGDLMNLMQFGGCSRNSPTNSEILAAAVPLETVTRSPSKTTMSTYQQSLGSQSNFSGEFVTSSISASDLHSQQIHQQLASPANFNRSVPKLNIHCAEDDGDDDKELEMVSWSNIPRSKSGTGYYRAKEEDTRSNRSLNRLYVIHGVDENEGLILATPEESLSRASSHSFSRSQSLSHSSSEASIDSGSIRLHSLHSEWGSGAPGNDPTRSSSSCCGVNLRSSPVPQSPPYEQSPSSSMKSYRGGPEAIENETNPTRRRSRSRSPNFLEGATAEIEQTSGRKREKSPKSPNRIDRPYLTRKDGVSNNNISAISRKGFYKPSASSASNSSMPCANIASRTNVSSPTITSDRKTGKTKASSGKIRKDENKYYLNDNDSQEQHNFQARHYTRAGGGVIMPTAVERAKRLSQLIQQRQHTQLQFSLNIVMVRVQTNESF
jgi:hypothetical protein